MKRLRILSIFMVLFSVIGFTSCDTEPLDPNLLDGEDGNGPTTPALFKVDFGGQTFTASSTQAVITDGLIVVSGVRGTKGEMVSLAISATKVGTYTGDDIILSYDPSADSEFTYNNFNDTDSNGTVTITSINTTTKTISGTFNFTGYWGDFESNLPSVAFTNGSFTNIPYKSNATPGTGDDEEYVRATIAGAAKNFEITGSTDSGEYLTINGQSIADDSNISVAVKTDIQKGTYAIGSSVFEADAGATYRKGDDSYRSTSGSLTIISNDGSTIKGTFSFNASAADDKTISITAGAFNIEY
jgi:hypothetical protein